MVGLAGTYGAGASEESAEFETEGGAVSAGDAEPSAAKAIDCGNARARTIANIKSAATR